MTVVAVRWPRAGAFVLALSLLVLSGCASAPQAPAAGDDTRLPQPDDGPPVLPPDAQPPPSPDVQPPLLPEPLPAPLLPKSLAESGAPAPVLALARRAEAERAAARHEAALAHWQRALRIAPRNPFLWHEIARTQLALQQPQEAESAARKSTSLARGNPWLASRNWRLIADARLAQQDPAGAAAARAEAETLAAP